MQTRQSECVDENDEPLPETDCSPSDKYDKQACATQKCPQWSVGSWGEVSIFLGENLKVASHNMYLISFSNSKAFYHLYYLHINSTGALVILRASTSC